MKKLVAAAVLLAAPVGVWAGSLDLSLSDETANLVYQFNNDPLSAGNVASGPGGSELSAGVFFNENGDSIVHGTLLARGYRQSAESQYQVSVGMRLLGGEIGVEDDRTATEDSESIGALALGVQAGMLLKPGNYNPVDVTFEGFYAPSITSFSDAERYGEIGVKLQVEVMPRARAYVGYRRIRFDTNDFESITLDRSAHVGLNISF